MQTLIYAIPRRAPLVTRLVLICVVLLMSFATDAQYKLVLRLSVSVTTGVSDSVFVAGSFNNWQPNDRASLADSNKEIVLKNLPAGTYAFKFTRGSWQQVECDSSGADIENRTIELSSDTILNCEIENWIDKAAAKPLTTASVNVRLIDSSFYIPQLHRRRRIWIYLPPGYSESKKKYPVIYMQDGQNLFDVKTAFAGEWGVDECMDSLLQQGMPPAIVVGIANGGEKRMSEYNPYVYSYKRSGSHKTITYPAEGEAYVTFLIKTLKPYIDKRYRTLRTKENTIIAGSSMGALISYYAALTHSDVFGKGGFFSPSFWIASSIDSLTDSLASGMNGKYFFYIGGKEGAEHVNNMRKIEQVLGKKSDAMVYSLVDPVASHDEKAWRRWYAEFYKWIMADGYNVITGAEN